MIPDAARPPSPPRPRTDGRPGPGPRPSPGCPGRAGPGEPVDRGGGTVLAPGRTARPVPRPAGPGAGRGHRLRRHPGRARPAGPAARGSSRVRRVRHQPDRGGCRPVQGGGHVFPTRRPSRPVADRVRRHHLLAISAPPGRAGRGPAVGGDEGCGRPAGVSQRPGAGPAQPGVGDGRLPVLSRSPVVHFDGPASVRAAYTPAELRALADQAGLAGATVRPVFPCRMLLTWSRP